MLAWKVAALAVQVLDACEERMLFVADPGIAYDHAAAEARIVTIACLDVAADQWADSADIRGACAALETALWLLPQFPLPTYQHAFANALRTMLHERGVNVPAWLQLVA